MTNISDKDKDKIIEDYLNGIPVSDTARNVGRSKSGIYKIIKEEGLTKEDFGSNIPAVILESEEEEKDKPIPTPKLDDTNNLYDLFKALGVEDNVNMQLYYCLRTLSQNAGMNVGDYIKEIVIPLMINTLKSGMSPDSDSINEFLQKAKKPVDKLHDMLINQAIEDFDDPKKEIPEPLTPAEEVLLFKIEMKKRFEDMEKERMDKTLMIMQIFPQGRWIEKLTEYAITSNDTDLIGQIAQADRLFKKQKISTPKKEITVKKTVKKTEVKEEPEPKHVVSNLKPKNMDLKLGGFRELLKNINKGDV